MSNNLPKMQDIAPITDKRLRISIDFDGVLMGLFLNKYWFFSEKATDKITYNIFVGAGDMISSSFAFIFRKECPGMINAVRMLSERYDLYLLTSRRTVVRGISLRWLIKKKVHEYFKGFYFREKSVSPVEHKQEIMLSRGFDIRIDDSITVINTLSKQFPDKKFIHFCDSRKPVKKPNVIPARDWNEVVSILLSKGE